MEKIKGGNERLDKFSFGSLGSSCVVGYNIETRHIIQAISNNRNK
jgi:hypothetical protein